MDLIRCCVQKPQELLWAERNHYYINYFHIFSLLSCITNRGNTPLNGWSALQQQFYTSCLWPCDTNPSQQMLKTTNASSELFYCDGTARISGGWWPICSHSPTSDCLGNRSVLVGSVSQAPWADRKRPGFPARIRKVLSRTTFCWWTLKPFKWCNKFTWKRHHSERFPVLSRSEIT